MVTQHGSVRGGRLSTMPAMMDKMKNLALSPSCCQSRFSRASNTADKMGTRAPAANNQHRTEYLHRHQGNRVGQCCHQMDE